jgi:enediyne biosynthesis protein E4
MNAPQQFEEEKDDAIIGQAVKWSLLALSLIVLTGLTIFFVFTPKPKQVATVSTPLKLPETRAMPTLEIPVIPFKDITTQAGIHFKHECGAYGDKLLPETMGGGCAFLDYDGDGDQDVLLVNSCKWGWDRTNPTTPGDIPPAAGALFQNDGRGNFQDVSNQAGLKQAFYAQGVAVGDYDNDGDVDLYFSAVGTGHLFQNTGGQFVDITEEAGVAGSPSDWGTSCGWLDYDNDGDLDLFVARYVHWSKEFDLAQNFQLLGGGRAYGRPQVFPGVFPALYQNNGGKFTDVSAAAGLQVKNPATGVPVAKSLGVTFGDFDRDGWIDIVVANDTVQNMLFHNQKNGTFEEIAYPAGIAVDNSGNARGAMGIDSARFRNNEEVGIAIGNFANEMTALYVAKDTSLQFVDEAIANGIGPQTRLELTFGTLFCDLDLDGRLDLIAANGHLEEDIHKVQASQFYEQPPHIFWNCGSAFTTEFVPVPKEKCGDDFLKRMVGRGASVADIDADGDLDILFASAGGSPRLLRNEQKLGHHWLRVQLQGTLSNKSAIGAEVSLSLADNSRRYLTVMPTRSYLSQTELPLTFGLGPETTINEVVIRWPSGMVQTITRPAIDQTLKVIEQAAETAQMNK